MDLTAATANPSASSWRAIVAALEALPAGHAAEAVRELHRALDHWPDILRRSERFCHDDPPVWWPLVRSLLQENARLRDVEVERMAASPHLANLRVLELDNACWGCSIGPLLRSPHLHDVWRVDLSALTLTTDDAEALRTGPAFVGLKVLTMSPARMSADAVKRLLSPGALPALRELRTCGLALQDAGMARLAANFGRRALTVLHLAQAGHGDAGVAALAGGGFASVRELGIASDDLTEATVELLADTNVFPALEKVLVGYDLHGAATARLATLRPAVTVSP